MNAGEQQVPTRDEIRQMVEENWRQFLNFAAAGSKQLGAEVIARFEQKTKQQAATMSHADAKAFLAAVEEERSKIFDEYTSSPQALKARLGVEAPARSASARSHRQGMGEMAVKTAVRASIWAAIWSLFR
jgi:hypothetical protein